MKKTYIAPSTEVENLGLETVIATSGLQEVDGKIVGTPSSQSATEDAYAGERGAGDSWGDLW